MRSSKCDICSSTANIQLNGSNVFEIKQHSLGGNPKDSDFKMPPTFAFNKKALLSILDLDVGNGWEDQAWRIIWNESNFIHKPIDNQKEFIWHIHGKNISTGNHLKYGNFSLIERKNSFKETYQNLGSHKELLSRIWVWNGDTIVVDFLVKNYSLAFDIKFNTLDDNVVVEVFDRNSKLQRKFNEKKYY